MGLPSLEVLGADVDNVAANGLGRVEGQREVLMDLVDAEFAFVDGALIYGAWLRLVDHLTAYATMATTIHIHSHIYANLTSKIKGNHFKGTEIPHWIY